MISLKNTKLTRIISIATVLVALAAVAGAALWTASDTPPVQADPPSGFEYGDRAKVLPDLIIIEGVNYTVQNQAEGFRLPLHSTYSVGETVIKENTGDCSGDVQCGNVSETNAYADFDGTFVAALSSEDATIVSIDNGKFKGVGVGTVFVKVAAGGASAAALTAPDGSSIRFAITVHEPAVWTRDLGIADLTVNEGASADFVFDIRRQPEAASSVRIVYDTTQGITISPTTFTIAADGSFPTVTATAARDENRDDEVVSIEFYFASGGDYHYNGRYDGEVTVRANDQFGAVVVPPTATATPVPAEQRQADVVCANLTGTAETNCLLREILNELQEEETPPLSQN